MTNEHNDPNLAETPHYKEKQTILPHPISAEVEKKAPTPVKRTHDGKPKKDKKDPCKSPMINEEQSTTPKEVCIKADEAKIDMRKLVIEHKPQKKSSSSGSSSIKKHSSSSSLSSSSAGKKEKERDKEKDRDKEKERDREKHKSSSSSDSHRSHSSSSSSSSKKSSHSSEKHRRDESRKSSSSSHSTSSSSEKHKSSEISAKREEPPKVPANPSQPIATEATAPMGEIHANKATEAALPVQVSSSHAIDSPASPPPEIEMDALASPVVHAQVTQSAMEQPNPPPLPSLPQPPSFDIPPLPPLPEEMPVDIPPPPPPPPPPPEEEPKSSSTSPDSSTQQSSPSLAPPPKVRKVNNGDKAAASSDLLGSIMASMDSPRNSSNF